MSSEKLPRSMLFPRAALLKASVAALLLSVTIHVTLKWWWAIPGVVDVPLPRYDFIIVGGGTAGSVLARRLWEHTNHSVLVVEAGSAPPWVSNVPLLAATMQGHPADWAFRTERQEKAQLGMEEQISFWPQGKALGGSSTINYLVHMWGARSDFDRLWSRAGPGWDFDGVKGYFQKSENFRGTLVSGVRGRAGPLPVQEFNEPSPLATAFIEGGKSLGFQVGDLNGDLEDGVMLSQSNTWNGKRVSTFDAYLRPVMDFANIHLLTNSHAIKLLIEDRTAVGVAVAHSLTGKVFQIRAKKEVIVCAGAVGSPHLLMLSGIGPKQHLMEHEVPLVVDLPGVGRNLRDHLNVPLYFHLDSPVSTTTSKIRSVRQVWRYLTEGKGHLSQNGVEAISRIPIHAGDSTAPPKALFMLFNMGSVNEVAFAKISNYQIETFRETFPDTKNESKEGFILLTSCTQTAGSGEVRLHSKNPLKAPLIDPRYLSVEEDVQCLIRAMRKGVRLGTSHPLRQLGSRLHLPWYEGCAGFDQNLEDDRYIECWIRTAALTSYHPQGTCRMGQDDDPLAVLDETLRVRGLRQLRVVDSSSFPFPTSGNPHAVVLMLAEKAADIILQSDAERKKSIYHHLVEP